MSVVIWWVPWVLANSLNLWAALGPPNDERSQAIVGMVSKLKSTTVGVISRQTFTVCFLLEVSHRDMRPWPHWLLCCYATAAFLQSRSKMQTGNGMFHHSRGTPAPSGGLSTVTITDGPRNVPSKKRRSKCQGHWLSHPLDVKVQFQYVFLPSNATVGIFHLFLLKVHTEYKIASRKYLVGQ